jgi:hypothetical protein
VNGVLPGTTTTATPSRRGYRHPIPRRDLDGGIGGRRAHRARSTTHLPVPAPGLPAPAAWSPTRPTPVARARRAPGRSRSSSRGEIKDEILVERQVDVATVWEPLYAPACPVPFEPVRRFSHSARSLGKATSGHAD